MFEFRPARPAVSGVPARVPGVFLAAAAAFVAAGWAADGVPLRAALLAGGATLVAMAVALVAGGIARLLRLRRELATLQRLHASDPVPCLVTGPDGRSVWANTAMVGADAGPAAPQAAFADLFADPDAQVRHLTRRVAEAGFAQWCDAEMAGEAAGVGTRVTVRSAPAGHSVWQRWDNAVGTDRDGLPQDMLWVRCEADGTIRAASTAFRSACDQLPRNVHEIADGGLLRVSERQTVRLSHLPAEVFAISTPLGDSGVLWLFAPVGAGDDDRSAEVFERLPVPLVKVARSGAVRVANRLARTLLSLRPDEQSRFPDLVEGLGRPVQDWVADAFSAPKPQKPEVMRATRADGDLFLQVTLSPIGSGDDAAAIAVLHDATELKSLQAQFVQSQKMQAIGQLAGGVAHDFNNLLTAISGHCDLLLLRHDAGDQDYADLRQIAQNANRAASLVSQLLAFSRKQNMRPELLDLRDSLADLTHLLNRLVGEKITLDFDHDPALQMIRADKRQLEQVIMNLVVNARDAMPNGGPVRIATRMERLPEPLPRDQVTMAAGTYVVVSVRDEGIGIPADKLPKIFEPFFTTKRAGEGTGLGLSTVYGIVKQSGGYIFADSAPGEGTSFEIYFPAHARTEVAPQAARDAAAALSKRGDGVVLLVEDEAPVRAFAARALQLRGFTVLEAADAEDALGILSDKTIHVDVFVTDVIMPGKDGPTWVREALVDRPDTHVVFVSGYAEESFSDAQAQIPHSVFLPKPFSLVELTDTVQAQFD